jgi:hypothetical protein
LYFASPYAPVVPQFILVFPVRPLAIFAVNQCSIIQPLTPTT